MTIEVPAVIALAPSESGHPSWRFGSLKFARTLRENELKIRMVSTGICHTDLFMSSLPPGTLGITYPMVMGHEGAGYVEEVGSAVSVAKAGDPVVLSYTFCQSCKLCRTGQESYCLDFNRNVTGDTSVFQTPDSEGVAGKFFGQSSFSSISIADEASIINVKNMVTAPEELKLLSPLGCGLLTGAGAVLHSAKPSSDDIVLVTGVGAVGFGAIMAAKNLGCKRIIAVDRVLSRLELAKELGASDILDTSNLESASLAERILDIVEGARIAFSFETTGVPTVITSAIQALGKRGKHIQLGLPRPGSEITIPIFDIVNFQKVIEPSCMGGASAAELVPQLIQWWRDGSFPFQKLIQFYDAKDVLTAVKAMEDGSTIKPVLIWQREP
ncbi:zinc-binding dehydrogenase [Cadophora sp. MPI-SDFR-AT-0126]|nr:zinc-binding dehydrogenase [Leotiomycetes sp. MPI-SDFR-AT-0126]